MKKILAVFMLMILYPFSCLAAYPDLCQSFGCYEESSVTKEVISRYGGWAKREAVFLAACGDKPSIMEIVRVSQPDKDGVVAKKIEIGIVNELTGKVTDYYKVNILCTKLYQCDSSGNIIGIRQLEDNTVYDMRMESANEFRLELWMGPVGNASPRVVDELNFVRKTASPPDNMDADLQKILEKYR